MQCPVCELMVQVDTSICPHCGYDKLNKTYLSATEEEKTAYQAEIQTLREAWQARQSAETVTVEDIQLPAVQVKLLEVTAEQIPASELPPLPQEGP